MTTPIKKFASLIVTLLLATSASAANNDKPQENNGNNGNHYGQIKKTEPVSQAPISVPEPAALALLGAGAAAIGFSVLRRRRRK